MGTPATISTDVKHTLLRALVERCTFGYTHAEYELAKSLGPRGYVEFHLAKDAIDDSALDADLATLPTLWWTPQQTADHVATNHPVQELKHASILRAVHSRRQLFERVVEFFTDHFNVYIKDGSVRMLKPTDDREVIRRHAFGSFSDLLRASMRSAAMLMHLDNDENSKDGPNENYARELMELHTLGVDGGYTETDVKEAARCLTGFGFWPLGSGAFGSFQFWPAKHDPDAKLVLGQSFPAGLGIADGDRLADVLLAHPSTPRFVSRKLARHLLRYEPAAKTVDAAVAAWTATDGDLRAVIRVLLAERTLLDEQPWAHRKVKRPMHFVASLLRAVGAKVTMPASLMTPGPLTQELRVLGQEPYDWPTPNGYPDLASAWGSALYARWSFASRLLAGSLAGVVVDPAIVLARLAATGETTPGAAVDVLLTGGRFTAAERRAIDDFAASVAAPQWPEVAEWIALGASSRSFQQY
jgi:uncharacterized protein (DUF1800 family)